jgi:Predicted glycosyltransferases
MIQKNNLFAIVVWYFPNEENLNATSSYVNEVYKLIIVDNSTEDNTPLISTRHWQNVVYLPNYKNKGIATALNQGCELALKEGAKWILTMDQDSHFDKNGIDEFITRANAYKELKHVAIFAPRLKVATSIKKQKHKEEYTLEKSVITSGSLLSLDAYQKAGSFLDDLFIDLVDTEYCIRLSMLEYKIVMINTVFLNHCFGNGTIPVHFLGLGLKKSFADHSPVRKYYIIRNSLYVASLYKDNYKEYITSIRKQFKRVILYDNRHKLKKIRFMIRGYLDYKRGIKGALNE